MNQVEYFSIGGYVFPLEGDACGAVREYLDQLGGFYSGKESGAEVMEGIEERMAELFLEKAGSGGVVTLPTVNEVIGVLGRPEAIEAESADAAGDGQASPDAGTAACEAKSRRRLYRDPANGKLAGVCSGLATYFDVDMAIFRISFVALTLLGMLDFKTHVGTLLHILFPLVYVILWICMPAVRSVRQRDELRGEGGTVDAISARIRNTPREKPRESRTWKNISRVFSVIFGVCLLLAGIAGVAFMCSFIWGGKVLGNGFFYYKFIEHMAVTAPEMLSFMSAPLVIVAAILTVAIPMFMMIYGGVMLIFGLKSPKWHPGTVMFIVWLGIIVALSVSTVMAFASIA